MEARAPRSAIAIAAPARRGARAGAARRARRRALCAAAGAPPVTLLDYGAGNVRSIRNAVKALGYEVVDVTDPEDISNAER